MRKFVEADTVFLDFCKKYSDLKSAQSVRPSEMKILKLITGKGSLYTPLSLALALGVSKPMVASRLSTLEKGGYIKKQTVADDKRSFLICPTEQAIALVAQEEDSLQKALKKIEKKLGSKGLAKLISLLKESIEALDEPLSPPESEAATPSLKPHKRSKAADPPSAKKKEEKPRSDRRANAKASKQNEQSLLRYTRVKKGEGPKKGDEKGKKPQAPEMTAPDTNPEKRSRRKKH